MSSQPRRDRGTWWTAVISLAVLTIITAIISYEHAYEVFRSAHNTGLLAVLGPVVADLVIAVCSMALLAASRQGADRPVVAIVALYGFVGVTVALNVAAGLRYGRGSALLAVLAPVGYLTGLHILAGMIRRGRDVSPSQDVAAAGGHCPHGVAGTAEEAVLLAYRHARDCLLAPVSYRQLERQFGVRRDRVAELVKASANGSGPDE